MRKRFDNYKFRCSDLGKIVSKSGKLTDGIKTYLQEIFIQETEGVRKEISSKYFEKGLFEEETGITLLQNTLHQKGLVLKNRERKSNDYIHGECDCFVKGTIYDIKNAWDRFTFGKAELTHNYEWQIRGYMILWNADGGRLFYCLNNTPEHLLCEEERKLFYREHFVSFEDKDYLSLCDELRKAHNYDDKPLHERFKVWDVELTAENIEQIEDSVIAARKYLNELAEEQQASFEKNLRLMTAGLESKAFIASQDNEVGAVIIDPL